MLVGVTGQIGSGKSFVCAEFERQGAVVIDADEVGKQVTGSAQVLKKLCARFGPSIQTASGKLRPKTLGAIIFADQTGEALEYLNELVQPKLDRELRRQVRKLQKTEPDRPVILDAAILPQWDMINDCDLVITVAASKAVRLKRLSKRGMNEQTALARMRSQMNQREYLSVADLVIHNDSSEKELLQRIRRIWRKNILQLSAI